MSDTPRTDYAFCGDPSVGVTPEMTTWRDAVRFAKNLERELTQARAIADKLADAAGAAIMREPNWSERASEALAAYHTYTKAQP